MTSRTTAGRTAASAACVYCLQNGHLRDDQVLLRDGALYVCAPRGQLVEGFLAIAPAGCIGCLARLNAADIASVARMQVLVRRFYAASYGTSAWTFYEQGRAGGGAHADAGDRFPLHAHLCGLPLHVPLHEFLRDRYLPVPVDGVAGLASATEDLPYLYVETTSEAVAYLPRTRHQFGEIERARLKPDIARLLGIEERGDWRVYPGDDELTQVTRRWKLGGW
jgi:hypothetical protein